MRNFENKPNIEAKHQLEIDKALKDQVADRVRSLIKLLESVAPEVKEKIAGELGHFLKRMLRIASFTTLAIVGGLVYQYQSSRYSITERMSENGEMEYYHEDPSTTAALNQLAGRYPLSDELRLVDAKERLGRSLVGSGLSNLTEGLQYCASVEDLKEFLIRIKNDAYYKSAVENGVEIHEGPRGVVTVKPSADVVKAINLSDQDIDLLEQIQPKSSYQKKDALYQALWGIEQKYGNPKVKIIGKSEYPCGPAYWPSGCYNFATNTIIIARNFDASFKNLQAIHVYLAEISHSRQSNDSYVGTLIDYAGDLAWVIADSLITGDDPADVYKLLYDVPDTVENIAHEDIEPAIVDEFVSKLDNK